MAIRTYLAGIAERHRGTGLDSPTAHRNGPPYQFAASLARTTHPEARKSAVTLDDLRAMLLEVPGNDLKAKRDRAVVLLGYGGAPA